MDFHINPDNLYRINYFSNYVYETQNLKTFQGKKLQKKRNHLNYFLNHYLAKTEIKDLNELDDDTILKYCSQHIQNFQNEFNQSEMSSYEQLIRFERHKDNNYKGIAVYIDNTLVALTLCYIRKDICEILIEKASKDIRGVYQYLLSKNLQANHIDQTYVDREDDNGNNLLTKSKMSYYPLFVVSRYASKN